MNNKRKDLAFSIMFVTICIVWVVSIPFFVVYQEQSMIKVYGEAFTLIIKCDFCIMPFVILGVLTLTERKS